jgi:hypothetical protein
MNWSWKVPGAVALLVVLAGCGAVKIQPHTQLPPPLIDKLPVTVAVYFPAEFRDYTYKEQRNQVDYEFELGPAHVTKLTRLLQAMFSRVVEIDDPAQALAAAPDVKLVLEPRFEDYAFLTPRDMVGDFYTVTIRYRLNLYNPRGERVDGYVFTGYGRRKSGSMSGTEPLVRATERAMRDAGAKLAIELPEQESVRRLLAGEQVAPERSREEEVRQVLGSFDDGQKIGDPAQIVAPIQEEPGGAAAPAQSPAAPTVETDTGSAAPEIPASDEAAAAQGDKP